MGQIMLKYSVGTRFLEVSKFFPNVLNHEAVELKACAGKVIIL